MKKNIFYIILGGILFTTVSVLAYNLSSNEVFYKKVNNQDMTVQQAIDDLYSKVPTPSAYTTEQYQAALSACPSGMICAEYGTPQYYATTGTYKGWCSSTDCNSYADFPTTATTPPSGKNVYAAKYADGQYGVCIKRNGKEHCFRGRNYIAEAKHLQEVFSDISCSVGSSRVVCNASDFACNVNSTGYVTCYDYGAGSSCYVYSVGSVYCS